MAHICYSELLSNPIYLGEVTIFMENTFFAILLFQLSRNLGFYPTYSNLSTPIMIYHHAMTFLPPHFFLLFRPGG